MADNQSYSEKATAIKNGFLEVLKAEFQIFESNLLPEHYVAFVDEAKKSPSYWIKKANLGYDAPDLAHRHFTHLSKTLSGLGSSVVIEKLTFWENHKRKFLAQIKSLRKVIKELEHAIQSWGAREKAQKLAWDSFSNTFLEEGRAVGQIPFWSHDVMKNGEYVETYYQRELGDGLIQSLFVDDLKRHLEDAARAQLGFFLNEERTASVSLSELNLSNLIALINQEIDHYKLLLAEPDQIDSVRRIVFLGKELQFEKLKAFLEKEKVLSGDQGLKALDHIFALVEPIRAIGKTKQRLIFISDFYGEYFVKALCELELVDKDAKKDLRKLCGISPKSARGLKGKTLSYAEFKKQLEKSIA